METLETPVVKTPPLSEQHLFLDKVLCDGRYLDDFQQKPQKVARLLSIQISPDAAQEISNTPLRQLLPSLYQAKFGLQAPPRRITPIVILIVILIVIGIVIVTVIRRASAGALVKDNSPHKDLKL